LTEAKLSLTAVEFHQSVGLKVQQMNWIKADWGREEEEEEEEEGGGALEEPEYTGDKFFNL
jgi:hypothetical protein